MRGKMRMRRRRRSDGEWEKKDEWERGWGAVAI